MTPVAMGKCRMSVRQSADEIEADAARWVLRLDREDRAPELNTWLAGDARRQGALVQAQAAWAMLDRARLLTSAQQEPSPVKQIPRRALLTGAVIVAGLAAALVITLPRAPRRGRGQGAPHRP